MSTIKEQDIVLVSKEPDGTKVIQMPITRVENVEGGVASVNNIKPDASKNITISQIDKATKAAQDSLGNVINVTYATKTEVTSGLNGKAASVHTHSTSHVTGLDALLAGKQPKGDYASADHSHTTAQVTNLDTLLAGKQEKGNYIKTINSAAPDSSGNIVLKLAPEIATTEEAQAGMDNTKVMSPLRVKEAINVLQAQPDWNAGSGKSQILNKPALNFLPITGGTISGNLTVTGALQGNTVRATSDRRLKENIKESNYSTIGLKTYTYNFIEDPEKIKHVGLIAQELKEYIPEAVAENSDGYLSVDYNAVVSALVHDINLLNFKLNQLLAKEQ